MLAGWAAAAKEGEKRLLNVKGKGHLLSGSTVKLKLGEHLFQILSMKKRGFRMSYHHAQESSISF